MQLGLGKEDPTVLHGTFETENGNLAVRRGAGEYCTEFVRGPRHRIDYVEVASAGLGHGGGGKKKGNEMDGREGGRDVPDAVCSECSLIFAQPALAGCCSFQMITLPS